MYRNNMYIYVYICSTYVGVYYVTTHRSDVTGLYACMHVCMYVCMHVRMYACMYCKFRFLVAKKSHTVDSETLAQYETKLMFCMYVCMYVCMYLYYGRRVQFWATDLEKSENSVDSSPSLSSIAALLLDSSAAEYVSI